MSNVVIDETAQQPPLTASAEQLGRLLTVMEEEIMPITVEQVTAGNKVFGAAVLDENWKTVHADSNQETTCPLFHGEVKVIYEWSQKIPAADRGPAAKSSIFLATHEPCCMCISSIVWAGFRQCYYLFPYTMTAAQGIPHDINTMHELWGVPTYRKVNKYIATAGIMDLVEKMPESPEKAKLHERVDRLVATYDKLSQKYHSEKANNLNNSLVLG